MLKGTAMNGENTGPGTTVGVNVALSGVLKDQNDITVYGLVEGEVISEKSVTIGKSAQVKGPVKGHYVSVSGVIRGEIDASDRLEITETGKVFGSITTKDLVIHSGAVFIGKATMPEAEDESDWQEEPTEEVEPQEEDEEPAEQQPVASEEADNDLLKPEEE